MTVTRYGMIVTYRVTFLEMTMSDETTAPAPTQTWEEKLAAAHPDVVAEFERILAWVKVCLGEDVAKLGGLTVDHGTETEKV